MRSEWTANDHVRLASEEIAQTAIVAAGHSGRLAEPLIKAVARTNAEMISLASQRTQAYLGLPARLTACRTPQDLVSEQFRFWTTAIEQYGTVTRHVMSAWAAAMPVPGAMPVFTAEPQQTWSRDFAGRSLFDDIAADPVFRPRTREFIRVPAVATEHVDNLEREAA